MIPCRLKGMGELVLSSKKMKYKQYRSHFYIPVASVTNFKCFPLVICELKQRPPYPRSPIPAP